jgi:MFS family permease
MKDHPFSRLVSQKKFIYLWASQILSQLTVNLVTFSIITHIYSTTKSSLAVSILWLAFSVPIFLFGPFSGGLVDRFDLRLTMAITNFFQALSVLLFLISGDNLIFMYVLVLFYSSLDRLYIPAQAASVPWLVEKELLSTANGLFFLTQQASILIGFGLGGVFVSLVGQQATVLLSSAFLFLAALAAYGLPKKSPPRGINQNAGFTEFVKDIVDGYKLLSTHTSLKFPFGLIIFLQAYITVVAVLLPSFTYETLGLNLNYASSILIIPGAVGALVSSFNLPGLLQKYRKKHVVQTGVLVAGLSLLSVSFSWILPHNYRLVVAALSAFLVGGSFAAAMIPANTFIQEKTPQDFSGRIYGLLGFFATVATMIPLMAVASLADVFGPQSILTVLSLLLLAGFIYIKKKGAVLLHVRE